MANFLRLRVSASSRWVISDFVVPRGLKGWLFARPLVSFLYIAFWILARTTVFRLPNYRDVLPPAGFVMADHRRLLGGVLVSELWEPE